MTSANKKKGGETVQDRQDRFLEAFRSVFTDTKACENSGISRSTLYSWLRSDAKFALAYEDAVHDRAMWLESRMFAVLEWATEADNYKEILHHPSLLQSALRGAMPEKYGDKNIASQEDAKRLLEELMKLKDDPPPAPENTEMDIDQELSKLFG